MTRTPTQDTTTLLGHWHHHGYTRAAHHARRFADMARSLDAEQLAAAVPGTDWQVVDVVAHVASVTRRYAGDQRRAPDADSLAAYNDDALREVGVDPVELASMIEAQVERLAGVADLVEPTHLFPFHGGQEITLAAGWGNLIAELLVHGDDIARATGIPWTVDGDDLEPLWRFAVPALAGWLSERGRAATGLWELRFGFDSGPVRVRFDSGTIRVDEPGDATADRVIATAPTEFTLVVPYRRRPPITTDQEELLALLVPL